MNYKPFNASQTTLQTGINLLEASAGTGKTYTIAMLVLRLVVEQGLRIQEILVVTFTKAATEELRQRIRQRLQQARKALDVADDELQDWLIQLDQPAELVRQRLDAALLDIDQAAIFTIHGFCQRVLAEHALQSGQLFDCQLTTDISALQQQCADDFWRQQLYPRPAWQVAVLNAHYASPEALLTSIRGLGEVQTIDPAPQDLDELFSQIETLITQAAQQFADLHEALLAALSSGNFTGSYQKRLEQQQSAFNAWLNDPSQPWVDGEDWTRDGILAGLNGVKFKTSKNKPLSSDEQKQQYLDGLNLQTAVFDELHSSLQGLPVQWRRQFVDVMRHSLEQVLLQNNVLSFDALISRLAQALRSEQGPDLVADLRQRLKAALIDEFQDTDQAQWQIFSQLFACDSHFLYLIGDPKQAIYQFRGADIFSYFAAQQQAQQQYTLPYNWRSHPDLVAAVNGLFARPQAFLFEQLSFQPVQAARKPPEGCVAQGAALQLWQLPACSEQQSYWTARKGTNSEAVERIRLAVLQEIVELLNQGAIVKNQSSAAVKPADIAILVRSNGEAARYQQALDRLGIKAVLNSKQSVFVSVEARELACVLQAVLQADQLDRLKAALTLRWFGLDGQQLYALMQDDLTVSSWVQRLQDYQQHWQQYGVFSMMQQLLRREGVEQHLAQQPQAERALTNIYHVLECVQQAAQSQQLTPHKTLNWLQLAIQQAEGGAGDEQQLRLESDADAVNIVTLHSAKGLEYPIVFCPDLWRRSDRLKSQPWVQCHENGELLADLGSEQMDERRQLAWQEQLAEDIRLFYVAVTRAQYRCYLVWADVRSKSQPNESAMAYLLQLAEADFDDQQALLQAYARNQPEQYGYRLLEVIETLDAWSPSLPVPQRLSARQRQRRLYSHWQMSSYTALSSLSVSPELPPDKAFEQPDAVQPADAEPELPRGAHTGNIIHSLLETVSFAYLAEAGDISSLRQQVCQRFGLHISTPQQIDELLQRVVTTPLAADSFSLSQIDERHCIKEMPFYLALNELQVSSINAILADSPTVQPLSAKQISGYLTGFIDLIVEYQGRFYVLDYKSNALENYQTDSLIAAMREHNYGLQYWLYSVVLDRFLQQRLPGYDYPQHFGGVYYLFVRGMNPQQAGSGVFADCPDYSQLSRLSKLLME